MHHDPLRGFSTRAIRAASRSPQVDQEATAVPIYQTATFRSADASELADVLTDRRPGYAYSRISNPTAAALAGGRRRDGRRRRGLRLRDRHGRDIRGPGIAGRCRRRGRGIERPVRQHALPPGPGAAPVRGRVPLRGRDGRRGRGSGLHGLHARPVHRDDLQSHHRGRRRGADGVDRASPRRRPDRRQHVRVAVPVPSGRARRRPGGRIGHEMDRRALGRHRRRRLGQPRPDGRRAGASRWTPAASSRRSAPSWSCAG